MKITCASEDITFRLGEHGVDRVSARGEQSHAIRNGLICALVVAICIWAAYPVAEMGFIDDWSIAKTAQAFAQTGHIVYNGWEAPILGWQAVWGALFIKVFGFSFTAVRLSMLPIAMGAVFLFHSILVRFGINGRNAVIGSLTLGLSPLFIPLAASYMTDLPGLFAILLCLYACQRAVAESSGRATIGWLCLAAALNVVGGTARQIAWLGALMMVPSTGWLLRKRHGVLLATSALWALSVLSIFACMRWFARQPHSVVEPILKGLVFDRAHLRKQTHHLSFELTGSFLLLSLLAFPILVPWLLEARRLSRAALFRVALLTILWAAFQRRFGFTMPWLPDVILEEFQPTRMLVKNHLSNMPLWTLEFVSLLVFVTALVLLECLWSKLRPLIKKGEPWPADWANIFLLLGPFIAGYSLFLLPRAYRMPLITDRYLLPMLPIAILCLLKFHQQWIAPTLPGLSVSVVAILGVSGMVGTHDWYAYNRERLIAIDEIRASGVPRTEIQGGFEYDGWTQIEYGGFINGAEFIDEEQQYRPNDRTRLQPVDVECIFRFARYTPAIHPKFTIVFPKEDCLTPSNYPPVTFSTWLPPFRGTIYIQEIPDGHS